MKYSFIIPSFNGSKYIKETIDSLLPQISISDEIIVINDNSTDDTQLIIESLQNHQIKLINLSKNIGAAAARNEGLKLATADYVIFIDSDDLWASGAYRIIDQIFMSNPSIDVLVGYVEHFFSPEVEKKLQQQYKLPPISQAKFGASLVIKRSMLLKSGGFNPIFKDRGEWIGLLSNLSILNPKIMDIKDVLFKRRIHETNFSHRHKDLSSYIPALRENIMMKRLKK